jgi:hypothetical protein
LVAAFLVIPVMVILVLLEIGVLGYEWLTGNYLGWELMVVGALGGSGAGFLLHQVLIAPYQESLDPLRLIIFLVLGSLVGLSVFGTHWLLNMLLYVFDIKKQWKGRGVAYDE